MRNQRAGRSDAGSQRRTVLIGIGKTGRNDEAKSAEKGEFAGQAGVGKTPEIILIDCCDSLT